MIPSAVEGASVVPSASHGSLRLDIGPCTSAPAPMPPQSASGIRVYPATPGMALAMGLISPSRSAQPSPSPQTPPGSAGPSFLVAGSTEAHPTDDTPRLLPPFRGNVLVPVFGSSAQPGGMPVVSRSLPEAAAAAESKDAAYIQMVLASFNHHHH